MHCNKHKHVPSKENHFKKKGIIELKSHTTEYIPTNDDIVNKEKGLYCFTVSTVKLCKYGNRIILEFRLTTLTTLQTI